jgi:hypothetical protein
MDLTISRQNIHIIIVMETEHSSIDKLDLKVNMINLDDPDVSNNRRADTNEFSIGIAYDHDNGKFLDRVVETKSKIHIPYEIWSARSRFNEASIVWYDNSRIKSVKQYIRNNFDDKLATKIISKIELQKHNE